MEEINQIYKDDCCNIIKTFPDNYFDLIIADPPYGNVVEEKWDKSIGDYRKFTESWLIPCHRVLKKTGSIYVWCSLGPKSSSLLVIADILKEHFNFQDMIVWSKQRGRGNRRGWLFTREEILWATKDKKDYCWNKDNQYSKLKYNENWIKRLKKENNPYKRATNVWADIDEESIKTAKNSGGKGTSYEMKHPTQKPVESMERIIKAHCKPKNLILDPFVGSGSSLVAAQNAGCNFVGIEKEQKYVDIANTRLELNKNKPHESDLFK